MPYYNFIWNAQIIEHLAEHGVSQDDFESVVRNPKRQGFSRATGLPVAWGHAPDGRYIICVFDPIDSLNVLPVTAYEV